MAPTDSRTPFSTPRALLGAKLAAFCLFACFAPALQAAIDDVPPPADQVFDDTRALETASHQIVAASLKSLAEDLKCDIWFTATTFTAANRTLRQQSLATRTRWSPQRPAILLAYDRTDNAFGFSFSTDMWDRYPVASLVSLTRYGEERIKDDKLALDERIVLIVQDFAQKMRELEATHVQQSQRFAPTEKGVLVALVALLVGAAFIAAILGTMARKHDTTSGEQYFLPDITVGLRLGALFGGGLIAEVQTTPRAK